MCYYFIGNMLAGCLPKRNTESGFEEPYSEEKPWITEGFPCIDIKVHFHLGHFFCAFGAIKYLKHPGACASCEMQFKVCRHVLSCSHSAACAGFSLPTARCSQAVKGKLSVLGSSSDEQQGLGSMWRMRQRAASWPSPCCSAPSGAQKGAPVATQGFSYFGTLRCRQRSPKMLTAKNQPQACKPVAGLFSWPGNAWSVNMLQVMHLLWVDIRIWSLRKYQIFLLTNGVNSDC